MHVSLSLRFLGPGGRGTFWCAAVLAVGRLAAMVLNVSGKYFHSCDWKESRSMQGICIHSTFMVLYFEWFFHWLVTLQQHDSGEATVLGSNRKASSFLYIYIYLEVHLSCNKCDQWSARMSESEMKMGHVTSKGEWEPEFLPAFGSGKRGLTTSSVGSLGQEYS